MPERFRYEARNDRYRDTKTGRYLPRRAVREAVDGALDRGALDARGLADALRTRKLSIGDWELSMRRLIKNGHLAAAAAARGGWGRLSPADYGRVGQAVRGQYEYLRNFAREIEAGLPLDGRFASRSTLYAEAARNHYHAHERAQAATRGFDEERNVLHVAEHCDGCLEQDARGWVAIGELVPVGQRTCMARCKCSIEYRNSQTGETSG